MEMRILLLIVAVLSALAGSEARRKSRLARNSWYKPLKRLMLEHKRHQQKSNQKCCTNEWPSEEYIILGDAPQNLVDCDPCVEFLPKQQDCPTPEGFTQPPPVYRVVKPPSHAYYYRLNSPLPHGSGDTVLINAPGLATCNTPAESADSIAYSAQQFDSLYGTRQHEPVVLPLTPTCETPKAQANSRMPQHFMQSDGKSDFLLLEVNEEMVDDKSLGESLRSEGWNFFDCSCLQRYQDCEVAKLKGREKFDKQETNELDCAQKDLQVVPLNYDEWKDMPSQQSYEERRYSSGYSRYEGLQPTFKDHEPCELYEDKTFQAQVPGQAEFSCCSQIASQTRIPENIETCKNEQGTVHRLPEQHYPREERLQTEVQQLVPECHDTWVTSCNTAQQLRSRFHLPITGLQLGALQGSASECFNNHEIPTAFDHPSRGCSQHETCTAVHAASECDTQRSETRMCDEEIPCGCNYKTQSLQTVLQNDPTSTMMSAPSTQPHDLVELTCSCSQESLPLVKDYGSACSAHILSTDSCNHFRVIPKGQPPSLHDCPPRITGERHECREEVAKETGSCLGGCISCVPFDKHSQNAQTTIPEITRFRPDISRAESWSPCPSTYRPLEVRPRSSFDYSCLPIVNNLQGYRVTAHLR